MTRLKVLASVSTLALGLALSGAAFAADSLTATGEGNQQANDGSTANKSVTADSNNPDSSTHGNNSGGTGDASNGGTAVQGNTLNANNSSTHTKTAGNNTGAGDASNGGENVASNNSLSNVGNDASTHAKGNNTGNGNASNGGEVDHSNNSDSSTHGNNSGTGDASNGGEVIASNNANSGNDSSQHNKVYNITVTATVSNQDLSGTVSGNSVHVATGEHGDKSATIGGITGSTYNGFAGIQTASMNTGLNSLSQSATSIAANANVTFGNVH